MHNLGIVFNFEVARTLKKKTFWISMLFFPIMMVMIFAIVFFSNKATTEASEQVAKERFSIVIKDDSKLVSKKSISLLDIKEISDKQTGIDGVKSGQIDAFFYYPSNLSSGIEVYGKDVGMFKNSRYDSVAKMILNQSVESSVSKNVKTVVSGHVKTSSTTFRDGEISDPIKKMLAPGFFLVMFYILIVMFGNQALTSTTEEKENRVIEMILTTIKAKTLVVGKILSLIALAIIQSLIYIIPTVVAYFCLREQLSLPSLDLSSIPIDWFRIISALIILTASFMLFIGLLVAIGAAVPTAKEASSFVGFVMLLIFGPLYAAPLFISSPDQMIVQLLSYFPLTAPIPLLIRNAAGTITLNEIIIATAILVISSIIVVKAAVRVFRFGALEYSRRLSIKEIFVRK